MVMSLFPLALQKKGLEVLFCYESYDEIVLMQLRQFNQKNIVSVEKELRQNKDNVDFEDSKNYVFS